MSSTPLPIIPQPKRAQRFEGPAFNLTADTVITAPTELHSAAQRLAVRIETATHWKLPMLESSDAANRIEFQMAKASLENNEAYTLKVTAEGVLITATHSSGAFYGVQSLLQLFPAAIYDAQPRPNIEWPAITAEIEDAPRFPWRGVMLDSSRYFQPVDAIKKYIDVLSQHKINVFHWHLVDDQGWRLEIKKYPKLTEIGSKRPETISGHGTLELGGDGQPIEGFYSQDEVRDLVAYASQRHVHILPEIEMPGHAQAVVAAYPELGLLDEAKPVSCIWGIHETLFNTKPATFDFIKDVLDEVITLFPFEYLHVGGDEAIKPQWKNDPYTQAHIKALGLKDEDELQSWFIREIETFLQTKNRKLVGWDEILEGGLAPGATVMSWRGTAGGIEAARQGNDAIMCANPYLYFDYSQAETNENEPLAIRDNLSIEKAHSYEPIPEELNADQSKHIIGVQCQLWTEYIATPSRLEYMSFPRVCASSEVAWSSRGRPDFPHFLNRLCTHLRRLDVQDVRYRAPLEYVKA